MAAEYRKKPETQAKPLRQPKKSPSEQGANYAYKSATLPPLLSQIFTMKELF